MFMDKDFLLNTQTAKTLFHETAAKCPIIDYHCHLNPKEIYDNLRPLQMEINALCRRTRKVHHRRRKCT